jgi:hypothetical protein
MNAAILTQLLISLGAAALELAPKLAAVWSKEKLTPQEIKDLCAPAKKTYDQYIAEAKARREALAHKVE